MVPKKAFRQLQVIEIAHQLKKKQNEQIKTPSSSRYKKGKSCFGNEEV